MKCRVWQLNSLSDTAFPKFLTTLIGFNYEVDESQAKATLQANFSYEAREFIKLSPCPNIDQLVVVQNNGHILTITENV